MQIQEKIRTLFATLDNKAQKKVLRELTKTNNMHDADIKKVLVKCCPFCSSVQFSKNGHQGSVQRYKCKECQRVFTGKTGTVIHGIKECKKFDKYLKIMSDQYLPLKKMAGAVGISIQTAFDWRHKILSGTLNKTEEFNGITEIDDVWFNYSQKGRKGLKYSRKRGGLRRKGDNKYQVKMLVAADREKQRDMSVIKIGRISKSDIQRKIGGKFNESGIIVSDKHRSISAFAKSEGVPHKRFKASEHTAGGDYHVQTVNNIASRLKTIVNHRLRGVSTKYLQNYSNWFEHMEVVKDQQYSHLRVKKNLLERKDAWDAFTNTEKTYKKFIKTYSERTYRCPVKRKWATSVSNSN